MFSSDSINDFSILFIYKCLMKEMSFSSQRDILVESVVRSLLPSATSHDILSECALIWVAGNGNVPCATKHSAIRLVSSNISTLIQERGHISVLSVQRHSIVQMTCEDTAEFTRVIIQYIIDNTNWLSLPVGPSDKEVRNFACHGQVVVNF